MITVNTSPVIESMTVSLIPGPAAARGSREIGESLTRLAPERRRPMKKTPFSCLLAAACLLPVPALAGHPGAHVHGAARLQVAVDGNTLNLQLETPLASLVGFEHAPRTNQQKQALQAMAERLRQAGEIFTPTPAGR